jgi:kynureninase
MTEYHVGTPTVFSLKGLEGALEMFEALDMRAFRAQSESDSACLIQALAVDAPTLQLLSPPEASRRGNHVAFYHPQAYALSKAMMVKGIMCDYRAPDLIRMSVNPLYINREDLERASAIIGSILKRPAALIHPVRHTSPRRAT